MGFLNPRPKQKHRPCIDRWRTKYCLYYRLKLLTEQKRAVNIPTTRDLTLESGETEANPLLHPERREGPEGRPRLDSSRPTANQEWGAEPGKHLCSGSSLSGKGAVKGRKESLREDALCFRGWTVTERGEQWPGSS